MTQQTKTEALEELARLIRRDIMDGTAPLNGVWWFTDDVRLQDRIAHVLLDYSDEEKPTGPTIAGATLSWMNEQIEKTERDANKQIDALNEKCVAVMAKFHSVAAENCDLHKQCDQLRINMGRVESLRIDTDMSDPQPGKLLVVRLDDDDVGRAWMLTSALHRERGEDAQPFWPSQFVGFLVETPAKKRGAWVVVSHENDVPYYWNGHQWTDDISRAHRWGTHPENWKGAGRAVFMADLEVSE